MVVCKPPPTRPRIQGLRIRHVLVEEPIIRELCDQAADQPPPAPQLGEEADYFRPSSTQVRIIIKTDEVSSAHAQMPTCTKFKLLFIN